MLVKRNRYVPRIDPDARVAASAVVVGNVEIARGAYVDHGVVVESGGPHVRIGEDTVVLAGTVIRSVGGSTRPPSPVEIGARTIVSPACVLTGCRIGASCYVATGVIVLQQAVIGDGVRLGAGSLVHATTVLPAGGRVGMREIAIATREGFVATSDVAEARRLVADLGFFDATFGIRAGDQASIHEAAISALLEETRAWEDVAVG